MSRVFKLVPLLLAAVVPILVLTFGGIGAQRPQAGPCASGAMPGEQVGGEQVGDTRLDSEQMQVATDAVRAVRAFPATSNTPYAAVIVLAAGYQESGLRSLDHGDRDSLGFLQQRPSQGWGAPAQVRDVTHATTTFLQHLLQISNWQTRPVTDVAADIQRPAEQYRDRYQQWVPLATSLVERLWATSGMNPASTITSTTPTRTPTTGLPRDRDVPGTPDTVDGSLADVAATSEPCDPLLLAGYGGAVTYPVPANLAGSDRNNWGGHGTQWTSWHTGTDFSVPCGTPVLAAHAGTVQIDTSQHWAGPWLVKITTGPHQLTTWYAHMRRLLVVPGQPVSAGQQIGEVGDLGNATGCHLHFEVHLKNGPIYGPDNVDPTPWLAANVGKPATRPSGQVRVATFNVLGYGHTAAGGDSRNKIDGVTRMGWTVEALNAAGVEIVGLQELEPKQHGAFLTKTAGTFAYYPSITGNDRAAKHDRADNVVAWRTDRWVAFAVDTVQVPYFGGHTVPMPYVLLQHRATGRRVWVISVHNPASGCAVCGGSNDSARAAAVRIEANLISRLGADGTPVILTGDMNDRRAFFCAITTTVPVHAANGGSTGTPCRPPRAMGIDWILGTGNVSFTGYTSARPGMIAHASDHPLVYADADFR